MRLLPLSVLFSFLSLSVAAQPTPQQPPLQAPSPQPLSATAAPTGAPVVYVSDFDLDVVPRKPAPKPRATRPSPRSKPGSTSGSTSRAVSGVPRTGPASQPYEAPASQTAESPEASAEETPADQANALVKAVSENLIRALTKAGFDARRLAAGAPLPQQGVRIRGVFAEADEQNRARRLLVGGDPVGPNLILYIGVNNLKNPEQPLYALADPPAPDPRHGPVITVTSYVPAERFEVSRDPSGEELEKVATKVAADLSDLVSTNRISLTQ